MKLFGGTTRIDAQASFSSTKYFSKQSKYKGAGDKGEGLRKVGEVGVE
jgi:hypothetical protein